jgi:outer membrane receptor protein involved in Fe transport
MIRADRRFASLLPVVLIAASAAAQGSRDRAVTVTIAAGGLDRALAALAAQTGTDIGSTDPGVAAVRVAGFRGRVTVTQALNRLLRGSGFEAERIDATTFRLRRRRDVIAAARPVTALPPAAPPAPDIVVIAAKSSVAPLRLAGAVTVLRGDGDASLGRNALGGLSAAAAATPIVQETALGTGRNKLFIRGVADSSFAGPTQSTAAVYWGDVPVSYTGADPGLRLYDVDRVEILEGPQGTLYGAGAIGGVIRLMPRVPDLTGAAGALSAGLDFTRGSAPGTDLAGMLNLPLVGDALGVRAVGYRVVETGYIDDAARGLRNVNAVRTSGGRVTLRAAPATGWTVDLGLVGQHVAAADLQYAERGFAPLTRASVLAQPFRQDYALAQARVEYRAPGGLQLVSATGYAMREAESRFDATRGRRVPIAYDTHERSRLLSHETRLSRAGANGAGWLVGVAVLRATDLYARRIGAVDRQRDIVGTANRTIDAALFGQVGIAATPRLTVTIGERLTHQRSDGNPVSSMRTGAFIRGVSTTRVDPTLGVSWLVAPTTAVYARYESGFRTGGITVAPGVGRVADLASDTIRVVEAGLRHERAGARGLAGAIGVFGTRWRRVQADLVDRTGFPFTTNIGDSSIVGVEASGNWVPTPGLTLTAAAFVNDTRLTPVEPRSQRLRSARLPNTPPVAASGGIAYDWQATPRARVGVALDVRYVGRSALGSMAPIDLDQGGFTTTDARASWRQGRWRWSIDIDNLFDVTGDRFASGNPFALAVRDAYTPLRPRSVRLGISIE